MRSSQISVQDFFKQHTHTNNGHDLKRLNVPENKQNLYCLQSNMTALNFISWKSLVLCPNKILLKANFLSD